MVFHDVSEARAMGLKMTHLAQHDLLTDLPNRLLLNDRITQAISFCHRQRKPLAVLFLDLDGFKHINDSLGHAIGDKLLRLVAQRTVACVRSSDTVSRHGGDEFVVLLPEVADAGDASFTAEKILSALAKPYAISERDLHLTGCIGISIYPEDGHNADTLITSADRAMYQAKGKGPNSYQFSEQKINVRDAERQFLERSLARALDRQEFLLHYQPKVDLERGTIAGAEALIRWIDPDRGLIPPAQFVPFAEDCGLIVPIGEWVLREACRQARAWMDAGLRPIQMAVNISAVELRAKSFLEGVCRILKDTRLEPHYLELELTESVLMQDDASTISVLLALKALGVQLAVDDFGTGYSSLSYLRRFPIDTLKIGQSFMPEISTNGDAAAFLRAVISMGKILKKRVVAEGVETKEQLAFLSTERCNEGQGYYFSPPVMAEHFAQLPYMEEVST
jgi:diguanylate cyclase (GGDEF)-like protein